MRELETKEESKITDQGQKFSGFRFLQKILQLSMVVTGEKLVIHVTYDITIGMKIISLFLPYSREPLIIPYFCQRGVGGWGGGRGG